MSEQNAEPVLLTPELRAKILAADPHGREIADLFATTAEKYWTYDPESDIAAEMAMRVWFFMMAIEPKTDDVMNYFSFCNVITGVAQGESKALHGHFVMNGKEIFVDVYTERSQLASLGKSLANSILTNASPQGGHSDAN